MDDRELSKRLETIEALLREIAYMNNIYDEEGEYIDREDRELLEDMPEEENNQKKRTTTNNEDEDEDTDIKFT